MTVYDEYYLMGQIKRLEAELAALAVRHEKALIQGADEHRRADSLMETLDASQKERDELHAWADTMLRKIEVLEEQIAAKDAEWVEAQKGWSEAISKVITERDEARAQIAELTEPISDAGHTTADGLRHEMEQLRAQIAASEQKHQDFRLQNDAEWRAKLDHLKAQIAAKDAALERLTKIIEMNGLERWLTTPAQETK